MLYYVRELQKIFNGAIHHTNEHSRHYLEMLDIDKTFSGSYLSAFSDVVERLTGVFDKPHFQLDELALNADGNLLDDDGNIKGCHKISISERVIKESPFCELLYFDRYDTNTQEHFGADHPNVLLVAPLAGHYATLLRDTVRSFIPHHNVYIMDWKNVRDVPLAEGIFGLDRYIDILCDFLTCFNGNVHVVAVCQPVVPVLAAVSYLSEKKSTHVPKSMVLMAGPVDARVNPGKVNKFGLEQPIEFFQNVLIHEVPYMYKGWGRKVCPGFLMLDSFMALNFDRHMDALIQFFKHSLEGDSKFKTHHKVFYDEYRAVMDLPADYYIDSVQKVFKDFDLPRGKFYYGKHLVKPQLINKTALLTIEGSKDDISCVGQTFAAHSICSGLKDYQKEHYVQDNVGHYGVFSGHRYRDIIYPRLKKFIGKFN